MQAAKRFDLRRPSTWLVMPQGGSRPMGMIPIPVPSSRPWAMRSSIAAITISTLDLSKIIVASNNATTRCVGLEASPQPHVSAEPLMRVRQFFRGRTTLKQQVSLAHQREVFRQRLEALSAWCWWPNTEGWRARSVQHVLLLPVVSVLTHPFLLPSFIPLLPAVEQSQEVILI
jgi:hypothetical protein